MSGRCIKGTIMLVNMSWRCFVERWHFSWVLQFSDSDPTKVWSAFAKWFFMYRCNHIFQAPEDSTVLSICVLIYRHVVFVCLCAQIWVDILMSENYSTLHIPLKSVDCWHFSQFNCWFPITRPSTKGSIRLTETQPASGCLQQTLGTSDPVREYAAAMLGFIGLSELEPEKNMWLLRCYYLRIYVGIHPYIRTYI